MVIKDTEFLNIWTCKFKNLTSYLRWYLTTVIEFHADYVRDVLYIIIFPLYLK